MIARNLAVAALALAAAGAARAETCIDLGAGRYASNAKLCVSSVLRPQAGNSYGPENLSGDKARAWCEGAPGPGQGEYIRVTYAAPVRFRSVLVGNGYAKSRETYYRNARARTVRIETGDGLAFAAELPDAMGVHRIRLPRAVSTTTLRLTVVDAFDGDRYPDLCLHSFTPDFEEMDRRN